MMTLTRTLSTLRPATFTAPLLIAALLLSACSVQKKADRLTFDGHLFRASAKKVGKQRFDFEVTVRPVSASLEGARNAGRHEATRYCIGNFGSSEVAWTDGPDAEDGRLRVSNDRLLLRGRCTAR